jgi:drug/metabolite transporter (DMT)-like permease
MNRVSPKVLALLGTLTLVWGTNWPLFKIALDELPVLTFRAIVLVTASLVLLAIMLFRRESFAVPRGKWPTLVAASAMNLFIWNIATSLAVLYIPSGHASVLAYTMPLWVALIGFAVFGQRLTGRLLAAILIGAAAVVALMVPTSQATRMHRLGSSGACSRASAGRSAPSSSSARAGKAWACRSPSGRS